VTASISATASGGMGYFNFTRSPSSLFTVRQTLFDVGQATLLQEHTQALSVRQAIAQSRKSRGLLDIILRRGPPPFKPTYNYRSDGSACRIFGTVTVKKVTGKQFHMVKVIMCSHYLLPANLHVTTLGHGYTSRQHVDHSCEPALVLGERYKKKTDQFCSDEFVTRYHRVFLWPILSGNCPAIRQFFRAYS
jgi:hypothetical protein